MKPVVLFIFLSVILTSCHSQKNKTVQNEQTGISDSSHQKEQSDSADQSWRERYELAERLCSKFTNKVELDTLLSSITHQQRVRVLATLKESWNDTDQYIYYSGNGYLFKLQIDYNNDGSNTVFIDGNRRINFKDYHITCYQDKKFNCEDYGFNQGNYLVDPKIVEVCKKQFLYADVTFDCNGVGCGCNITFIYDLTTQKATFLENFRIPFNGFFLSDFDNDNQPDLLVISQSEEKRMKDYYLEEFEVKLTQYRYDKGNFKPAINQQNSQPVCYDLYSICDNYFQEMHTSRTYSVVKNNWLSH